MVALGSFWAAGVLLVGCGASRSPSPADVGSAGNGGSAGGSPPLMATGGGGGNAGSLNIGGTTTTNTNGGVGGIVWPDKDIGPVPPGTACQPDYSIVEGTVEGHSFSNAYRYSWPDLSTFSSWWYSWLAPHGKTQIFTKAPQMGEVNDPRRDLMAARAYPVQGWLSFDSEGPNPNALYCLNEGSTLTPGEKVDERQPIEMALSVSKLGTCPGTPVSGNLTFCYGPNQDATCPKGITGELAGEPVMTTLAGIARMGQVEDASEDVSTFLFGERWLRVRVPKTGGALEGGLLLDADDTFELTEAYCLDAGTVTTVGNSSYKVSITSISKLGACSGSATVGTARVCTATFH